ncbi:MAG: tRNA glutamyl-Q(34) synthetase GluQRS [Pirellulaceae bacterium]|nr:tRNA glutamyl-Q(34) synthetase GluQRS [Pirellulaceae bacterium]
MNQTLTGRLAPSPTGAQHIGNARTFLIAWLSIRSRGGKLILRIEDIDSPRVKQWAIDQAIEDLTWLGLDWDEGPDRPGHHSPYLQTERTSGYRSMIEELKSQEMVYPCTCSRSDVLAAASAPHELHSKGKSSLADAPIYPKRCAYRSAERTDQIATPFSWRYRTSTHSIQFHDQVFGLQKTIPAVTLGDFVVGKSDGSTSYQLAVVHDDHDMEVTEVLRGDDLIPSTFRQLDIYQFLGWKPPQFVHVPLVVGEDGRRLAKRHGDTRLSFLRENQVSPLKLIGWLAASCGWLDRPMEIAAADLLPLFNLDIIPRKPAVFDAQALDFLQGP